MFKKSLVAVLFSLIMAMVLGTSAFAAEGTSSESASKNGEAQEIINKVNDQITKEIKEAQTSADELFKKYNSDLKTTENVSEQKKLYATYNREINVLINNLKATTRELTLEGMKAAREIGVNTRPELIRVEFADRFAMIDPMVGVGW